ncbi:DUF934 domain-containing protein [Teredinibacter waterburyi]|jgi:Uncharacterized protein conserved in bacteria|uniref:DUF934 domain-containing protein n=1 Tax=Teredinibacter waterburyi TaxID=1500538 RepID=UPI00165F48B9|nr:DUF934 domain-containing protein [Teredinibacter waterburyi]
MPKLVKNGQLGDDTTVVVTDASMLTDAVVESADFVVSLDLYNQLLSEAPEKAAKAGLLLNGDQDPASVKQLVKQVSLICIEFPVFTDGRGFSLARMIRDHFDYTGELRATGAFIQDQLFFLKRCGFSSFVVADETKLESAIQSLNDFTDCYQAAADEPQPLYRRR